MSEEDSNVEDIVTPGAASGNAVAPTLPQSSNAEVNDLIQKLHELEMKKIAAEGDEEKEREHLFWNTQPVPQPGQEPLDNAPIETKKVSDVRTEPYALPAGFEWSDCDMCDPEQVEEVYQLLCQNYVEDDDNMFRFDYSKDFLQWALRPPGYNKELHVGVRVSSGKKKLVGLITGVPAQMVVNKKQVSMVEINFLCVLKKLRSKRVAPVLIKEITRRVNLTNVWQAVYTAGVVLPKPVACNRYYHRSLNPKKLIDVGFSRLQPRMTMKRTIQLYSVAEKPAIPGIRLMVKKDVKSACALLNGYLDKFSLHQHYSQDDFWHWLGPKTDVVCTYVVEDPETKKITDLISFYNLPSTIIGHKEHNCLKAAYSFYHVPGQFTLQQLMGDALVFAKQLGFDVFNALNVMDNDEFLKELKFGIGDGKLQYYLYNWSCKEMQANQVGLVLL